MSNSSARDADEDREHLDGIESGAGCAEIWERLSERRDATEARDGPDPGVCADD